MQEKELKSIRIKDIAERCGVSTGTVDRVLYNRGGVKESTKEKVLKTLREMNYTPNMLAKTLALKKNYTIIVFIPDPAKNDYWKKPLAGIKHAISDLGNFNLNIETLTFDLNDEKSFVDGSKEILQKNPAGVVFNPVFRESAVDFCKKLDNAGIHYSFMDMNIDGVNQIAYYGQDAETSGHVAAKLMNYSLGDNDKIAVLKISDSNIISRHILHRAKGFTEYLKSIANSKLKIFDSFINLSEEQEPDKTLKSIIIDNDISALFIPNSKSFVVVDFIKKNNIEKHFVIIGYDLINKNIKCLKDGLIDFLISQKPEEQAYKAIKSLFDYILLKKTSKKINHIPIDIIIKENIDYYKKHLIRDI